MGHIGRIENVIKEFSMKPRLKKKKEETSNTYLGRMSETDDRHRVLVTENAWALLGSRRRIACLTAMLKRQEDGREFCHSCFFQPAMTLLLPLN